MKAMTDFADIKKSTIVRIEKSFADFGLPLLIKVGSVLAPELMAAAMERIFLKPPKYNAPDAERALLATGHRFTVKLTDGRKVAAWSWGDGPTVFLVHGWAGRGGQLYPFVRPLVDAGYSVVLYDAPAHGESDGNITSLVDMARTLTQVVSKAGPAHAVIAHSIGAASTLLAMSKGLKVESAILIAPPSSPANYTAEFAKYFGLSDSLVARIRARVEARYRMKWEELNTPAIARQLSESSETRVLVIHDEGDRDVRLESGRDIANAWNGARLTVTQGLGHRKILRSPEVIRETTDFVGGKSPISE